MNTTFQCVGMRLSRAIARGLAMGGAIAIGATVGALGEAKPAASAEQVVFTFGPLAQSFAVDELAAFAETGDVPSQWRFYFNVANADETDIETVQSILTEELRVSLTFLDEVLNTIPGEFALFELGQIFHTKSRQANIQALRAAVVLSAADDGRISLLEFLENYPVQELYVDGEELSKVARDVGAAVETVENAVQRLEAYWAVVKDFLSSFICECETSINGLDGAVLDRPIEPQLPGSAPTTALLPARDEY